MRAWQTWLTAAVVGGFAVLSGCADTPAVSLAGIARDAGSRSGAPTAVTTQQPGLACPQCGFSIKVSLTQLLMQSSIMCPACGLNLSMDQDGSKLSLEQTQQLYAAQQQAEERRRQQQGQR